MKDRLKIWPPFVRLRQWYEFFLWKMKGQEGGAPHLYKQQMIKDFSKKYQLSVLIETGTYLGEMVYAMQNQFTKIYSIELAHTIFERAKKRFAKYSNVTILEGDSESVLPKLISEISNPTLFWLDGHYSGGETARANQDTPVFSEVRLILENMKQPFTILIDDARLFVGKDGYPTIDELNNLVAEKNPGLKLEIKKDIIRIFPH